MNLDFGKRLFLSSNDMSVKLILKIKLKKYSPIVDLWSRWNATNSWMVPNSNDRTGPRNSTGPNWFGGPTPTRTGSEILVRILFGPVRGTNLIGPNLFQVLKVGFHNKNVFLFNVIFEENSRFWKFTEMKFWQKFWKSEHVWVPFWFFDSYKILFPAERL